MRVGLVAAGLFHGALAIAAQSNTWFLDRNTGSPTILPLEGGVYCSASDGQGGYFVGGLFTSIRGVLRRNAAHLLADGSVSSWAPDPNGPVTAIALVDASVYLGGTFTTVGGLARERLASVHSGTGAVSGWAPSANAQSASFARIGDRVFVGGGFSLVNGVVRNHVAAFDLQSGALLPYAAVAGGDVYALAVRDTVLYVGGEGGLRALSPTTGLLARSLPGGNAWVGALAVAGDVLYVGGGFSRIGGQDRAGLAAVDLTTGTIRDWNPGGGGIRGIAVDGDHVFICGSLAFPGGGNRSAVARLSRTTGRSEGWAAPWATNEGLAVQVGGAGVFVNANFRPLDLGSSPPPPPVSPFPEVDGPVFATATVGDTLYIGGAFHWLTSPATSPSPSVARSNLAAIRISTGEVLDWNAGTDWTVRALVPRGDKLIVCGSFRFASGGSTPFGQPHAGVAVIDRASGNVDPWNSEINVSAFSSFEGVYAADVFNDTLYVGGRFSMAAGQSRIGACAFDLRTGGLTAWNPSVPLHRTVMGVVRVGSRVYLGGDMNSVGGVPRTGIAEVDAFTGGVTPWNPDFVGTPYKMLRVSEKLYVAGSIARVNGQSRGNGAAFSVADGTLLPWDPHTRFDVQGLAAHGNGILLGWWSSYEISPALTSLGWFDGETGEDLHAPLVYASDRIWSLSAAGGKVFLGGAFTAINGSTAHGWLAAVPAPSLPTPALPSFVRSSVGAGRVELTAYCPLADVPALERREQGESAWVTLPITPARQGELWRFTDELVERGRRYAYRLIANTPHGVVHSQELEVHVPGVAAFSVAPVQPNPNPGRFDLAWHMPEPGYIEVEVLDVSGRRVHKVTSERMEGAQTLEFELPNAAPPGLYLIRLSTRSETRILRFCLVR